MEVNNVTTVNKCPSITAIQNLLNFTYLPTGKLFSFFYFLLYQFDKLTELLKVSAQLGPQANTAYLTAFNPLIALITFDN
ncbi:MAG: hypothetical protein EAZ76_07640 [Nostocales cyanobacterium]|nr:MAG: hypothetical protein EAZ87_21455 [Nostocales cyanobacterium]TAF16319.1 MAG: hypothetical protein EAZ76_07640 [Nostocales cyanobacterium]